MGHQLQEGVRAGWMGEMAKTVRLGTFFAVALTVLWGVADFVGDALGR